jgi:biopolymer transport protein TolR
MAGGVSSGNGGGRRNRGRAMSEINVAPLVDVMLVLLIISMLASPMLERGIPLELPATETAREIEEARVVVSLDRDGRIRINDRPVHPDLLVERMEALARTSPSETVFLRADRLLPYGEVLLVMDHIRKAGVTRVALVTVPLEAAERAGR